MPTVPPADRDPGSSDDPHVHAELQRGPGPISGEHGHPQPEAEGQAGPVAERQARGARGRPERGDDLGVGGVEGDDGEAEPFDLIGHRFQRLAVLE
jgi:hypothetical protein